ncbi:hypothetical protein Bca52824_002983 [Brassica carinata]|uniref:GRF-type domain-containing protein n=1 Tax=Brassica carinata TaxID=52824 RepID=A0A8X7WIW4_BRACI|nr:hypothetical protein Bca52824_002983 [Brassica carinata]
MDLKSGSSSNSRNRGYGGRKLCACRLPTKVFTAWTDKNSGRRFLGCELYKEGEHLHCSYFEWLDEEEVVRWPKRALIKARDEIREKKRISELNATVNFLRLELEKLKVEKPRSSNGDEESICNEFVKLLNRGNLW